MFKFDKTLTIGNIIVVITLLGGFVVTYYTSQVEMAIFKTRTSETLMHHNTEINEIKDNIKILTISLDKLTTSQTALNTAMEVLLNDRKRN